ncbi:MAG: hypothetical protein FJY85_03850 [Deltaproteobacteria bacterium]|nr:hypothetical protein [Deltaproteobacteria bacterium]
MDFKWLLLCISILTQLALSGCAEEEYQQEVEAQLRAMRAEIESMVGVPTCSDIADCAYIAFGSKPCGGPWTYLIYSRATIDPDVLAARIREYNDLEDRYNHRFAVVSDCSVAAEPRLTCANGVCVGR